MNRGANAAAHRLRMAPKISFMATSWRPFFRYTRTSAWSKTIEKLRHRQMALRSKKSPRGPLNGKL
jgi:hypothetical protein